MLTIDNAFNTENSSVFSYYQRPGVGFYIPLYQREYSWDQDNIEQLLEDISKGIEGLIENGDDEIRFLGTIITVTETDKSKVQPQDTRALPSSIEKVIDGQQRLSTISLISALLYHHISVVKEKIFKAIKKTEEIDRQDIEDQANEICDFWQQRLKEIFSVDLKRGNPQLKPKIIRGSKDKWVMAEEENMSYNSSVSLYLYEFIEHFFKGGAFPKFDKNYNAGKNLHAVHNWLNKTVSQAHVEDNGFCSSMSILENIKQENIWQYDRDSLKILIDEGSHEKTPLFSSLSILVQTLAVCHYLLDRCCFTIIQPVNDDWAFDMFQSLNATGTPLTAIETFKPLVVNVVGNEDFKKSIENKYFSKIEIAFEDLKSAAQKSKLTNELLTSFALPIEGKKLASHFSTQRKWLEEIYNKKLNTEEKRDFIKFFGNYTEFYNEIWNNYSGKDNLTISKLAGSADADLTSLLLLFLKESNHKMAITILGSFYSEVIEGKENSVLNFVNAVKAIAAFYILWRSSRSNSGLDDVYRTFFKGSPKSDLEPHTWIENKKFDVEQVKRYLLTSLNISDKKSWIEKSSVQCSYENARTICKFALLNAAHETIADMSLPGLLKKATAGSSNYLRIERWNSRDLETIEHIAPVKSQGTWSETLYGNDALYNSVGNLTLLPSGINTSASNKGWKEKLLYYRHLSEKDPDKLTELTNKAIAEGIHLGTSTLEILKNSNFSDHIQHILTVEEDKEWNSEIVQARSNKIMDLLWERVYTWLK